MSKVVRGVLAALALIVLLAILLVWMGPKLLGANIGARLSARVSAAVGMQVSVEGPVRLQLFPRLHLTLANVHIHNNGTEVAAVAEVQLAVAARALLHKSIEIEGIGFKGAQIHIERDRGGHFNVENSTSAPHATAFSATVGGVAFSDSSLIYKDAELANAFSADHCNVDLKDLRLVPTESPDLFAALSFSGELACAQMHTDNYSATNLKTHITATRGLLTFDPLALQIFGGRGSARLTADFTGAEPVYHLHGTVQKLQLADFSNNLKAASIAKGDLDFATDLRLHGTPKVPVMRTANGEASLRGTDLVLEIGDLDKELSRYESTQNFNLVDVGAFFLAGPLGVALTKGYDYARILKRAPGTTNVRTLISQWQIEAGVAQAQDVALATPANRIAMHGGLDFVDGTYQDVTVALISPQGCARVEQKIRGAFSKPVIDRPNVVATLAGPVRRLVDKGKSLFGAKCPVFYSGSVSAPK
jgi:uncharacterized protein involved in outer membrane biogenesis